MNLTKKILVILFFVINSFTLFSQQKSKTVFLVFEKTTSPRVLFGIEKLKSSLKNIGYQTKIINDINFFSKSPLILLSFRHNKKFTNARKVAKMPKEGYTIISKQNATLIEGADESGSLYGCLEVAEIIFKTKKLPDNIDLSDAPEMVLRGQCIGLQKSTYLPGRNVYEYPYSPETFPWFYDKKLWLQVLDSMVDNRMNSLYLWNGHPFASLVKLKDYPYAVEVDDATFKKNEEIYKFITSEADKRGIWVIQMFYNIIVSKPFAEHHNIKTQERERHIVPVIADYTKKSIAAFVEKYPNVGLMVCLGEAMEGVGNDDIEWFTKTIIPGVQDGLKALSKTEEPPIVLRAHDCDAPAVMKAALPLYKNLYTEAKFNGEALTYARPRGSWAELHQTLSKLGSVQIENVHILANLEPFRYGSPDFIQQSVIGMHEVMGGNGLHLYPQSSYWDWPYSADSIAGGKRLLQIERDWIWYKAWSRYAWKAKRNREEEINYWSKLLAEKFGCSIVDGERILKAYEESGEIAPKLLRRFGITDGNRQTLMLGMTMPQLINPGRFGLFQLLYDCESPEGETITEYAEKEFKGENHSGETPVKVIDAVRFRADDAVKAITAAEAGIKQNRAEFMRLKNDILCYQALAYHYSFKVQAALDVLKYKFTGNKFALKAALLPLTESFERYRQLVKLTNATYSYANSMQTQQRKIPFRGVNGTYKKWNEVIVPFEKEYSRFKSVVDSIYTVDTAAVKSYAMATALQNAKVKITDTGKYLISIDRLTQLFSDTSLAITKLDFALQGFHGLRLPYRQQMAKGTVINFTCEKPVKVLVGFFKKQQSVAQDTIYLKEPELETNASADDYGQAEIKISNAIAIEGMPPVNIHAYSFKAGTNTLKLEKGVCLIIGFVDGDTVIPVYDAGLMSDLRNKNIDWLFE